MKQNSAFWEEVLVGRKITSINWKDGGIDAFVLDSGEVVKLYSGPEGRPTICIEDGV